MYGKRRRLGVERELPPSMRANLNPAHCELLVHDSIVTLETLAVVEESEQTKAVINRDDLPVTGSVSTSNELEKRLDTHDSVSRVRNGLGIIDAPCASKAATRARDEGAACAPPGTNTSIGQ